MGREGEPATNTGEEKEKRTQSSIKPQGFNSKGYLLCHHAECGKLVLTNSRGRNQVLWKYMGATKTFKCSYELKLSRKRNSRRQRSQEIANWNHPLPLSLHFPTKEHPIKEEDSTPPPAGPQSSAAVAGSGAEDNSARPMITQEAPMLLQNIFPLG